MTTRTTFESGAANLLVAVGAFVLSLIPHVVSSSSPYFRSSLLFIPTSLFGFVFSSAVFWNKRKVAIYASLLGCLLSIGVILGTSSNLLWHSFGWYMVVLAFFHWSEYVTTALVSPSTLTVDSFLLNHSKEYWIAAGASWIEFVLEVFLVPKIKTFAAISTLGLLLCVTGEILRKAAMFTAGSNFTHLISYDKQPDHTLVKGGIYSVCRHPSYVGWFLWSVGTQVLLCNPICFVGYTLASWRFFRVRIEEEEIMLVDFFGQDYVEYQREVPTGLPFIHGFKVDL